MQNNILVEVCCGGIEDCLTAIACKADRIELNSALELGGLTPSLSVLKAVKKQSDIPVCCMVRPRGAGFCYSEQEYALMKEDAKLLLANGADGIVFGFLLADGTIDTERTKEMVSLIHPKEAVFHKAFDSTPDLAIALQELIACGVDRVLTSGGASYPDMEAGMNCLASLQKQYGKTITILPGGGVREHNVQSILRTTQCKEIHMTAKETIIDPSTTQYPANRDVQESAYVAVSQSNLLAIMKKIAEL